MGFDTDEGGGPHQSPGRGNGADQHYSHIPEVHDAITKLPGSLKQSIEAIRRLRLTAFMSSWLMC